jgi:uncharacterized membrane protein (DUF2068 family)
MTDAHDAPRSRRIIRLIAIERVIRGLLLLAGGTYLLAHLGADYGRLAERMMRAVELDPRQHFLHHIVARLHGLHAEQLRIAGVLALAYGGIEIVEGTGLWLDQLWAEYLTVIVTTVLIPFEVYELVIHPTIWKTGGIAVNLVIVAYLAHLLRRRVRNQRAAGRSRRGVISLRRAWCPRADPWRRAA